MVALGLQFVHAQALAKLEGLVMKALDVLRNRVEVGLRWISGLPLVDLAGDRLYGYDEFDAWQAAHLARQTDAIAVRCVWSQHGCIVGCMCCLWCCLWRAHDAGAVWPMPPASPP